MALMLKHLLLRSIPEPLLHSIRRYRYLRSISRYRPPEAFLLAALLHPGDCAVDVGAHAGWYTRTLAELVGPCGRILALEPVPPTFRLLCAMIQRFRLTHVTPICCAASDRPRAGTIEVPAYARGGLNFYGARLTSHASSGARAVPTSGRSYPVREVPLDSILGETTPQLVKIDVEGHEWRVVQGMRRTLARCRPALLIEITSHPDNPSSPAFLLRHSLARLGYSDYWLAGDRLCTRRVGHPSVNYFFLAPPHVARLQEAGIVPE